MTKNRLLSVGELAELARITVRTLHHYDEVGLLRPSHRSGAGYRRYSEADLERLQAILVYRELGLGLSEIAAALDSENHHRLALLEQQKVLLVEEHHRIHRVIDAVDSAISAERKGVKMTPEELFEVFGAFDPRDHQAEAAQRWPAMYKTSQQRTSGYTKAQWQQAVAEADSISRRFAELLVAGDSANGESAMDLAEEHRMSIDKWYYPCSKAIHSGLAEGYLVDSRFFEHWEEYGEGVAQFVRDAIVANAAR